MSIIPSAETQEAPRERKEDVKPGMSNVKVNFRQQNTLYATTNFRFNSIFWFALQIFFLILFGMICAIVLAVVGIMYYQKRKENSRKLW